MLLREELLSLRGPGAAALGCEFREEDLLGDPGDSFATELHWVAQSLQPFADQVGVLGRLAEDAVARAAVDFLDAGVPERRDLRQAPERHARRAAGGEEPLPRVRQILAVEGSRAGRPIPHFPRLEGLHLAPHIALELDRLVRRGRPVADDASGLVGVHVPREVAERDRPALRLRGLPRLLEAASGDAVVGEGVRLAEEQDLLAVDPFFTPRPIEEAVELVAESLEGPAVQERLQLTRDAELVVVQLPRLGDHHVRFRDEGCRVMRVRALRNLRRGDQPGHDLPHSNVHSRVLTLDGSGVHLVDEPGSISVVVVRLAAEFEKDRSSTPGGDAERSEDEGANSGRPLRRRQTGSHHDAFDADVLDGQVGGVAVGASGLSHSFNHDGDVTDDLDLSLREEVPTSTSPLIAAVWTERPETQESTLAVAGELALSLSRRLLVQVHGAIWGLLAHMIVVEATRLGEASVVGQDLIGSVPCSRREDGSFRGVSRNSPGVRSRPELFSPGLW